MLLICPSLDLLAICLVRDLIININSISPLYGLVSLHLLGYLEMPE
jgi:hypothetical protein